MKRPLLLFLSIMSLSQILVAQTMSGTTTSQASSAIPPTGILLVTVRLDDLDGDGLDDYAVANPLAFNPTTLQRGAVRIISSGSNLVLNTIWGSTGFEQFGNSLAAGDFDGDGRMDLVVAAPLANPPYLKVIDTMTLTTLASMILPPGAGSMLSQFGRSIELRDIDGDGKSEILATSHDSTFSIPHGMAHIFAGGTGNHIATISDASLTGFASTAHFLDDVDGDGIVDVVVAANLAPQTLGVSQGYHGVYNPVTGSLLHGTFGSFSGAFLGDILVVLDDMDGDGIRDYAVTRKIPTSPNGAATLILCSGASGSPLLSAATGNGRAPLNPAAAVMDVDGDGKRDIALLSVDYFNLSSPRLSLYSSGTLQHIDELSPPPSSSAPMRAITTIPDQNGNGFEHILLESYQNPTTPGPLSHLSLGPVLPPAAAGNHATGAQLLEVNGSTGGPARRIDLNPGQSFTISFLSDPVSGTPTDFIVFGMLGVPDATTVFTTVFGNFAFPPAPAAPGLPWLFTLADTIGFDPGALFAPAPAPFALPVATGLPLPINLALQGVSISNGGTLVSITNGILLDIH